MFRRARADERDLLDEMTLAGARHWGHHVNHPEAYSDLEELIGSQDDPDQHPVYVMEEDGEVVGFYELRDRGDHVELLRMFVQVSLIGKGHGRRLWEHAVAEAVRTHTRVLIMSDPGSVGFCKAMGAGMERTVEVSPGFHLGLFWYRLRDS